MNIIEKLILKIIKYRVSKWFAMERELTSLDNVNESVKDSPEKSWPDPERIPYGEEVPFSLKNIPVVGASLSSCIHQGMKAVKSVGNNPVNARFYIDSDTLQELEQLARLSGVGAIGYAKLPSRLIFKDRSVLYDNAIVLISEMDKDAIMKAPSVETFKMVMSTYDTLGKTTNLITEKLRGMGYQAQASHPLGGLVLYPPLAAAAGLGWFGRHGLLITPQFGPRQRISAIFTSISNLPVSKGNEHSWIEEFCAGCGKCIRVCPSQAIYEQPVIHNSWRKTHIIRDKCLPVFVKQQGCTVCVKECIFTQKGYKEVYEKYKDKRRNSTS